jgi:hypothetical protein
MTSLFDAEAAEFVELMQKMAKGQGYDACYARLCLFLNIVNIADFVQAERDHHTSVADVTVAASNVLAMIAVNIALNCDDPYRVTGEIHREVGRVMCNILAGKTEGVTVTRDMRSGVEREVTVDGLLREEGYKR